MSTLEKLKVKFNEKPIPNDITFDEVERLAKERQVTDVYLSTNHIGLYEKYGWEFFGMMDDMDGEPSRVYVKKIK